MKFVCSAHDLIDGLQVAVRALPARTTNPVLNGILMETGDDIVKLTCSDERITIVTCIDAEIKEPGRGVVPGKLFNEVVRRLNNSDIDITMNDRFMFTVRGAGSRTNIAGQDASLFSALPDVQEEHRISMPQDMLKDMITKIGFAIAIEDMREVLTGAYLEIQHGDITMVGMDGYRMAIRTAKCSEMEDFSAIIPGKAAGEIGKLLSESPNAFVDLSIGRGKLHIHLGGTDIFVILLNGNYIQYRNIIPASFATQVTVDMEPFRKAVDRAALMAMKGNNNLLMLKIADNSMAVESKSEIGDVFEQLDIIQEGADLNIAFNVKYLIDIVRNVDAEQLVFKFNNSVSPVIVNPANDRDYTHLILPVRTAATA